jgi:hypothetical protein
MKSFSKEFLHDALGDGPRLFLAAWGKHPGWDDHMDDIGLETESLVTAKLILYDRGIGENLGGWERLTDAQRIPSFHHIFVWRRGNQTLVGRMWPSRDGKGRARYPMTLCAHCVGISPKESLESLLPHLEELEGACIASRSPEQVRMVIDQMREQLRGGLGGAEVAASAKLSIEALAALLADIQVRFGDYLTGTFKARRGAEVAHYRLPACAEIPAESLMFWLQFLDTQIDSDAPALFVVPLEERFIDLTVGEPTPQELYSLRAGLGTLPLSSEPRAREDAALQQRARAMVEALLNPSDAPQPTPRQRSWFQFFR